MPRTCTCNDLDGCSLCRAYEMHPAYADWALLPRGWNVACRHRGAETRRVEAPTNAGAVGRKVFACAVHGECTAAKNMDGVACCVGCEEYTPPPDPEYFVIDPGRLAVGHNLNGSLIVHRGRRLLAYRHGWSNARIYIAALGSDWQPTRTFFPVWTAPSRYCGHEDPRLFLFRDKLHCSFTGFDGSKTDAGYVRLKDDLSGCEGGWVLNVSDRQPSEKNWVFFEWDNDLYAVYTSTPHIVLRIEDGRAERLYRTHWQSPVAWGEVRGGASPVRVGDEFYHWFHTHSHPGPTYALGLYAFEARPPFRPTRAVPRPLALPTERMGSGLSVIYPGGAVLDGEVWRVACGYQDTSCRIYSFNAAEIERELLPCR